MSKSPRQIAFEILDKINRSNAYSNLTLDYYLNNENLNNTDKAFVSFLVYGVIERLITIDYQLSLYLKQPIKKLRPEVLTVLRLGVYQILFADKVPDRASINESVNLVKNNKCAFASGLVNAVLRNVSKNGLVLPNENDKNYLSVKYSCPDELINLWKKSYSEEKTIDILSNSLGNVPLYIRTNTLKTTSDELIDLLKSEGIEAEKSTLSDEALVLHNQGGIENLKCFKDGLFHVQDLSSQICCKILDAKENDLVYDVCSAPGGKSFTISQYMKNKGKIKAYDIYPSRVNLILNDAKRLGIDCINAEVFDASVFDETREKADKVLCDVPCSGLGIIRRKPEIKYKSLSDIDKLHNLQYLILCVTAKYVKDGGTLVYSTCSINPNENTEICKKFSENNKEFKLCEIDDGEKYGIVENNMLTILPGKNDTDGFFVAKFVKN